MIDIEQKKEIFMKQLNKLYLGTNTKMYKTISETTGFIERLQELTKDISREKLQLFVLPSYTALESVGKISDPELIAFGSQNISWDDQGQFTGEVSPIMIKETGASIAMIGHSERRHIFRENDLEENLKIRCSLRHGFTTLLCIGETEEEKEKNISDEVLKEQLKIGLYKVAKEQAHGLWIAYEPVWAIGVNGKPASKQYASEKHKVIKQTLNEIFGEELGEKIPVLYGGSVNNENAEELISMEGIDGLFIGRSAWDADNFNKIIRKVMKIRNI